MNHSAKLTPRAVAVAAVVTLSCSAFAADYSANIEFDNTYRSGSAVATTDKGMSQNGRVELNATGKAGGNMFVAAKAAFLAQKSGGVATDDMWIQLGTSAADVKLGRFEAADLFVLPGDTLVNNAGAVYGTNALRGRKAANVFHAAGTFKADALSFELGVVETRNGIDAKGIRPVVSYALGPVRLAAGFETGKYASGNKVNGAGASVTYDFGGFKLTGNASSGKSDALVRNKTTGLGLIATVDGLNVGLLAGNNDAPVGKEKVQTLYASYKLPLFDIKGASVTPALSTSTAKNSTLGTSKAETSFRLRFNYAF